MVVISFEPLGSLTINEMAGVLRIIEDSANLIRLSKNKFRKIENTDLSCKVYEAKSKRGLRVYFFEEEKTGRIIVTGGKKGNQEKDIKKVVKTIKEYQDEKYQQQKKKNP